MDGQRRVLRSLKGASQFPASARIGLSSTSGVSLVSSSSRVSMVSMFSSSQRRRFPRRKPPQTFSRLLSRRGTGTCLVLLLLSGSAGFGFIRGGHYDAFVVENGSISDMLASTVGFGLEAITITGTHDLGQGEILSAAGLGPRNSLLMINAATVREDLKKLPLVADANVRKLYPNRLIIEITEREPFGVWQKDGQLLVISSDGTPIDELRDHNLVDLPFVVGAGANERVGEYLALLDVAGDLRSRVRAGILVGQRRWTLKLTNGLDVKLPEAEPEVALAQFARLTRDMRLLDKDLISVDLRIPGRLTARLTEEALAVRQEAMSRKKGKGGPT